MDRREFLQVLACASAAGLPLAGCAGIGATDGAGAGAAGEAMYDIPRFGNVSLLHFTDCHAQLLPVYFREPSVNIGVADANGKPPHLVGEHLLKAFGIGPGSARRTPSPTSTSSARRAPTARSAVSRISPRWSSGCAPSRPGALLLDGGDTWQGSATALWTNGQDMVDACKLLGVDMMSPHWEFTLRREAGQGDHRQGLQGQHRVPRAERQDHRFRRPGVQALRDAHDQRRCRWRSSDRPFPTRRSPTRATWSRIGASASRTSGCRRSSTRRAPKARRSWWCCRTTAWTST